MNIYTSSSDFHTSVQKALDEIDPLWRTYKGLIVCGSHAPDNVEEKLAAIKKAREGSTPTLGICMGLQLMAIEFARNVLKIPDATSAELGPGKHVVYKLPNLRVGIRQVAGLGPQSHWHNYAVHPETASALHYNGFTTVQTDGILEWASLESHPFFVGVQFHPEYQSTRQAPHPILSKFLQTCRSIV